MENSIKTSESFCKNNIELTKMPKEAVVLCHNEADIMYPVRYVTMIYKRRGVVSKDLWIAFCVYFAALNSMLQSFHSGETSLYFFWKFCCS